MKLALSSNQTSTGLIVAAVFLFLFFSSNEVFAQKREKYTGIGFNKDKIELLYQNVNYTSTSSSGRTYSGTYRAPLLRINGGESEDYDPYKLLPYMKQCPSAKKEIVAYQTTRKKGKEHFVKGFLLGGAAGFAGVIGAAVAGSKNEKLALPVFVVGFGSGVGLMVNGMIKARKNIKKSQKHLENSVVFYNQKCYQEPTEIKADSLAPIPPLASGTPKPAAPKSTGVVENHRDTFYYKLLRNDPKGVEFVSAGLHVLDLDIANFHGFNYWLGADVYYQKTSRFAVEALFRTALVDNLSAESSKGGYGPEDDHEIQSGEAANYKRAREMSVLATIELFHKDRESKEEIYIGSKTIGGRSVSQMGEVKAKQRVSWAARVGAIDFRSVWYNLNGLPFASSPFPYVDPNTGEVVMISADLSESLAMVRSTSVTAGLSRRIVSDLDIDLLNTKWKGKRKSVGVSEIYADVAYALSINTGNVYTVTENPFTGDPIVGQIDTKNTPLSHIGWRAGFRNVYPNGFAVAIELGQRPGPNDSSGYLMLSGQYRFGKSLR